MDGDGREVALLQQLVQVRAALHRLDEDDHLVEHERIQQVVELAVLLRLGELDVMLHEAVERELGFVVHVDLHGVVHELLAHGADLLGQRGAEHHHLLVVGGHLEDLLHVAAHVELLKHLVTLVQDEVTALLQADVAVAGKRLESPRGGHNHVGGLLLELLLLLLEVHTTEHHHDMHVGQVRGEALELVADLVRQLARVAQNQGAHLSGHGLELLQHR
mmetsp:Transcript_32415/g.81591  ORF Transcript_32415/g.81591 Transcript_32415/m.81591 type:complete len:218 (-) Transcript_32415:273-926(-)